MRTHITHTPAEDAGKYIQEKLESKLGKQPILFLVSGGSSLLVLNHIHLTEINLDTLTVTTTDERFTSDTKGNNFLQILETPFLEEIKEKGVKMISTVPYPLETYDAFVLRIEQEIEQYYQTNPNAYTIGLFGIGEDGHTASIFPMSEEEFNATFTTSEFYTKTSNHTGTYPQRTSITPTHIEEMIDDVVLFAVGSNKCDNILNYMHNRNFSKFQIPALIPAQHPESILFTDCETMI